MCMLAFSKDTPEPCSLPFSLSILIMLFLHRLGLVVIVYIIIVLCNRVWLSFKLHKLLYYNYFHYSCSNHRGPGHHTTLVAISDLQLGRLLLVLLCIWQLTSSKMQLPPQGPIIEIFVGMSTPPGVHKLCPSYRLPTRPITTTNDWHTEQTTFGPAIVCASSASARLYTATLTVGSSPLISTVYRPLTTRYVYIPVNSCADGNVYIPLSVRCSVACKHGHQLFTGM